MHLQVDDYPTIRQQYGKSVAHMTLDSVALFTQSALREMDLLARLDDGEFIVLLPGSTLSEANQIAKRLQTSAANCVFPLQNEKTQLRRDPRHRRAPAERNRGDPHGAGQSEVEAEVAQKHLDQWLTSQRAGCGVRCSRGTIGCVSTPTLGAARCRTTAPSPRFQFSLRWLLIAVAIVAVLLGLGPFHIGQVLVGLLLAIVACAGSFPPLPWRRDLRSR